MFDGVLGGLRVLGVWGLVALATVTIYLNPKTLDP